MHGTVQGALKRGLKTCANTIPRYRVGKPQIEVALGHHPIEQGIQVKWIAATALVQLLQQVKQELDLMGVISKLDKYRVLIIDGIGYEKKADPETQVLFGFNAHR